MKDLEGKVMASTTGSVTLPYVSEENHDEDPEIRVGVSSESPPAQRLHQAMLAEGRPLVKKKIATFVTELRAGGPAREELQSKGGGVKASDGKAKASGAEAAQKEKLEAEKAAAAAKLKAAKDAKAKEEKKGFKTISMTQRFRCRASDLYDVLMDDRRWMAFTHSKTQISRDVGGSFTLFDGAVSGTNEKLEANSMIVQKWRFNTWPDNVYSMVRLSALAWVMRSWQAILECYVPHETCPQRQEAPAMVKAS